MTTKDVDAFLTAQGVSSVDRTQDKLRALIAPLGKGSLRSAKIMLDMDRQRGGLSQSRGFGFVEFKEHAHALACLRELNNNAAYGSSAAGAANKAGQRPRLIVEFTLENMQKVMLLKAREERMLKRKAELAGEGGGSENPSLKKAKMSEHNDDDDESNGDDDDDDDEIEESDSKGKSKLSATAKKRGREDGVDSAATQDPESVGKRAKLDKKAKKDKRKALDKKRKEKQAARKMKKIQKQTGGVQPDLTSEASVSKPVASGEKKKKGLFARIRAEKKDNKKTNGAESK